MQGKLKQLSSNEKSMSTVVGIIDGTGSLGAALGQIIVSMLLIMRVDRHNIVKLGLEFSFYPDVSDDLLQLFPPYQVSSQRAF